MDYGICGLAQRLRTGMSLNAAIGLEQRRREDAKKRMKAEIGKAESRNPRPALSIPLLLLSAFCFLHFCFLLRVFAVQLRHPG